MGKEAQRLKENGSFMPWLVWLTGLEHGPLHRKATSLAPSQDIYLGCEFDSFSGHMPGFGFDFHSGHVPGLRV